MRCWALMIGTSCESSAAAKPRNLPDEAGPAHVFANGRRRCLHRVPLCRWAQACCAPNAASVSTPRHARGLGRPALAPIGVCTGTTPTSSAHRYYPFARYNGRCGCRQSDPHGSRAIHLAKDGACEVVGPSPAFSLSADGDVGAAKQATGRPTIFAGSPKGKSIYTITETVWCGREDSNFHGLSATTTSTLRVYQFRHDRTPIRIPGAPGYW